MIKVKIYIFYPLRCHNCQKFVYLREKCIRLPLGKRWEEIGTDHMDCEIPQNCTNCKQNHAVWKRISEIKPTKSLSYLEVKKTSKKFHSNNLCKCSQTFQKPNPKPTNDPLQDCPVGWGCRIHRLHLCSGGRIPPLNECPWYDTKQSDGEVPVMLGLWGMQSIPSFIHKTKFIIYSDSKSVLWVQQNKDTSTPFITKFLNKMNPLSKNNSIILTWILNYVGIYGNKKANNATKKHSWRTFPIQNFHTLI